MAAPDVVVDTVRLVAEGRNGIAFRLNTIGLCDANDIDLLLSSGVLARSVDGDQRRETRIATVRVFLSAANPIKYAELLQPKKRVGIRIWRCLLICSVSCGSWRGRRVHGCGTAIY